jgi:hypothetical protein
MSTLVNPNQKASQWRYEQIQWAMERKKQAYLNENPQIRAHSDQVLPDSYESDDEMSC